MIDRAAEVAAYLVEEQDGSLGPAALWTEMRKRWPDLSEEEGHRAAAIAVELLSAGFQEIVQRMDHVRAVMAGKARMVGAKQRSSATSEAAQAIHGWGEVEVRDLARRIGLSAGELRPIIQAIQRGGAAP